MFDIIIKTLFGLEEVLVSELQKIGAKEIQVLNRAVKCKGDQAILYKANLHLRTAIKVLKPIAILKVRNEEELYKQIRTIRWSSYLGLNQTFAIDATSNSDAFTHSKYVALKSKDAIVDQFRDTFGKRPSIDTLEPDLRINIHIYQDQCTVSLDSSGTTLAKRGYRKEQSAAPISEALAAGMILLSGWDMKTAFLDPMCGSGTIPIEAALIANKVAPGINRTFAFEKWKDFDEQLWEEIRDEAEEMISPNDVEIYGSDLDFKVIRIAERNAELADCDHVIDFQVGNFLDTNVDNSNMHIVINPPYGERLNSNEDMVPFYKQIGTQLKHHCSGSEAWIITSDIQDIKFIGLRPSRKIKLFNGPLECRFQKYELFKGKKKDRSRH